MAGDADLEAAIMDVDALPLARRPLLAFATVHTICTRGARAAMAVKPEEEQLAKLTQHVRGMEPTDPTTQTMDGWTRLGAVEGAIKGWRNEVLIPPKGAPTLVHAAHYMGAGLWAFGIVWGVKHG